MFFPNANDESLMYAMFSVTFKLKLLFSGFPINVIALLPVLVQNYENPSQRCRDAADHIVQVNSHLYNPTATLDLQYLCNYMKT